MLQAKVTFFYTGADGAEVCVPVGTQVPKGDPAAKGRPDFFEDAPEGESAPARPLRRKPAKDA